MHKKIIILSLRTVLVSIFFAVFLLSLLISSILFIGNIRETEIQKGYAKIAIVIDDFGRQRSGVSEMLSLPCKLTCAVIPFLEYTEDDAQSALENGKEVIIHIPMQATSHDKPTHLGTRYIKASSTKDEITEFMHDAYEELPEAVGANIHMGTICSSKKEIMSPIIEVLKDEKLFFLDSMTSRKSVCREIAEKADIIFYENDVFLEHEKKTKEYVKSRLKKAEKIAQKTGECIVIGHVGYEGGKITASAISEMLSEFYENGIELVFLSEISSKV